MYYPIAYADQMVHYLRDFRKVRGLTQKELAKRLGVSQARVAEIEANPKLISVAQLLQILGILQARLVIEDLQHNKIQKSPTVAGISLREGGWE